MPRAVRPLSQWSIVADLLRDVERLRGRSPSQALIFTHDNFTAAGSPSTTYSLSYLPVDGSVLMAKQGLVQREGIDYSVNGATGVVTVTASQSSGDRIVFEYRTTGELVANNATVETDAITDDFNRADSGTTINPASDGGTWTAATYDAVVPVLGIKSNAAYSVGGSGGDRFMYRDVGSVGVDMSLTFTYTSFSRGVLYFAYDPATKTGYRLDAWASPPTVSRIASGIDTSLGSFSGGLSSGTVVRVTYTPTTGVIALFFGGVSRGTVTDGSPITAAANTCVGFGATQDYYVGGGTSGTVNTGETWDNFTASP